MPFSPRFFRNILLASLLCAIIYFALLWRSQTLTWSGLVLTASLLLLAIGFRGYDFLKGLSFTVLIFAAVAASMYYPAYFLQIGTFKTTTLIVPLLQVIMFGMGAALSWRDFARVVRMPRGVIVGVLCQFTIMPLTGYTIPHVFNFPPEIAAGIILVGCSPSGLASNVMSYLAKANLALSVTLTTVATLLAPVMTPFLMKFLAGQFVPIDFWGMMWSIIKIVIIPVFGGLIFNHFFHNRFKWLAKVLPIVSMAGIALIITIITAAGRDSLLVIGIALIAATLMHNLFGYILGYLAGRLLRMPERECRTIALEVGMQNGGLASGIALEMGKVATVGLAPAVFGPMMNITGSSLATWWRGRPLPDGEETELAAELEAKGK